MNRQEFDLDSQSREITIEGRTVTLVEKNWQVLRLLIEHAPEVVPRSTFVQEIWGGNWLIGDKNLNQAIWSIRRSIGEQRQAPKWIRTVPRGGYQWLGGSPSTSGFAAAVAAPRLVFRKSIAIGAGMLVVAVAATLFIQFQVGQVKPSATRTAENAFAVGADVHVEFSDGLLGILKNRTGQAIGSPTLSQDGSWIAIPLLDGDQCKLVTVDLNTRERKDYLGCPYASTKDWSWQAAPNSFTPLGLTQFDS